MERSINLNVGNTIPDRRCKDEIGNTVNAHLARTYTDRSPDLHFRFYLLNLLSIRKTEQSVGGVVIRWFKKTYDASPTITLFLSRKAMSQTKQFDRVHLWIEPGFSELRTQSVKISRDKEWNYQATSGLTFDLQGSEKHNAKIYIDTLAATLWNNYTNASYVEYDKMDKEVIGEVFGKVKLRDIEMVFSRTQFPPKFKFK